MSKRELVAVFFLAVGVIAVVVFLIMWHLKIVKL